MGRMGLQIPKFQASSEEEKSLPASYLPPHNVVPILGPHVPITQSVQRYSLMLVPQETTFDTLLRQDWGGQSPDPA